MKARKQETLRFTVKWIVGNTMYFRAFKRDRHACEFMDYLVEQEQIPQTDVRIIMH